MRYFTINELTRSETARARGIDNRPDEAARRNLEALTEKVLDPLREAWGKPITVNSGYRSAALNKAVGGKATSQHLKGEAADITTGNKADNERLFKLILDMGLPFDQLIDEKGYSWLHVSYGPRNRRQILKL